MNTIKRKICAILILILALAVSPVQALAAGPIQPNQNVTLNISYKDGEKAIPHARFSIFKVANVDEYAEMTLTSAFEPYKNTVSGLANLGNIKDNAEWLEMASTLKGYVLRDRVALAGEGETDSNGQLVFAGLKPGLYLVIGYRTTLDDFYTYSAVPFMTFLPGSDSINNDWLYDVTVSPKYSKEYNPPDDPDDVTRKVIKVWDDAGFETIRPEEVTVQLLRNGTVYDTQILHKANNWRYAWDNLERECEWTIVELTPEGYAVTITETGIITTIKNKFIEPVSDGEIFVLKQLTGQTPPSKAPFTFVLTAANAACPMPTGSPGRTKEITVYGAGSIGFGEMEFTKAGIYEYTVYEKNSGIQGYTYDQAVYTVTYSVTEKDGELKVDRTIKSSRTGLTNNVIFTNEYGNKLPQTGVLWWPVPLLLCAGIVFVMVGIIRRRRSD